MFLITIGNNIHIVEKIHTPSSDDDILEWVIAENYPYIVNRFQTEVDIPFIYIPKLLLDSDFKKS